ncbi:MAG: M23 family metallopeptidase [Balneolaceae bacterium]|nr:M23 family metallopeptidase [Balneolaceae bacterium]
MEFINLITNQIIVPFLFVFWLWNSSHKSRINWLIQLLSAGALVASALIIGAQSWTSIYTGGFLLVFFMVATIKSFRFLPKNWIPFYFGENWSKKILTGTQMFIGLIFLPLSIYGLTGYSFSGDSVSLRFPMQDGVYYVAHGGSNPLINYHNVHHEQTYAMDISELNVFGVRAAGLYPNQLDRYKIFGEKVYSPCTGTIQKAVSHLPDNPPPERDSGNPKGNHVQIKCKGVQLYLAHLKKGSVSADSGNVVHKGALLGEIGNSGNTSEPHLHIHAVRDGKGIPITFNGRFLARNSLVWR